MEMKNHIEDDQNTIIAIHSREYQLEKYKFIKGIRFLIGRHRRRELDLYPIKIEYSEVTSDRRTCAASGDHWRSHDPHHPSFV